MDRQDILIIAENAGIADIVKAVLAQHVPDIPWRVAMGKESAPAAGHIFTVGHRREGAPEPDLSLPLRAGALADYVRRLAARQDEAPHVMTIGPYRLDVRTMVLEKDNGAPPVRLTEKETAILEILAQADGAAIARDDLLARVWNYADNVETHTIETHIYRLRQKIEADPARPQLLLTDASGYRLSR